METFKEGDKVIYGGHGMGKIDGIVEKDIQGHRLKFYEISFEGINSKIFIPINNVEKVGLRRPIDSSELDAVFSKLKNNDIEIDPSDWKNRYRENLEKLKSGNIFKIAEVIRDLTILNKKKTLSMREMELLEKAKKVFTDEISAVKNTTPDEVMRFLDSLFDKKSQQ